MPITSVLLLHVTSLHLATMMARSGQVMIAVINWYTWVYFWLHKIISLVSRYGNKVNLNGQCKILGLDKSVWTESRWFAT